MGIGNSTQIGNGINIVGADNAKITLNNRNSETKLVLQSNIVNFYESKEIQYNQYITNIYNELEKIDIPSKEIYEKKLDHWLTGWKKLDENSQKYLISGEYIYESLLKTEDIDDYSPFVLQFCRIMENQIGILCKQLAIYYDSKITNTSDILQHVSEISTNTLQGDMKGGLSMLSNFTENKNDYRNKMKFANQIQMLKGISAMQNENWKISQIINTFLDIQLNRGVNLKIDYIEKIDLMRDKYRNASAHPGILTKVQALIFREFMTKEILPVWVNGLK
jgi:hypothetical protein